MAKKNLAQSTKQRSASLLGKEVKKNLPAERGWDDYVFFLHECLKYFLGCLI